jgi:hypothetical protein
MIAGVRCEVRLMAERPSDRILSRELAVGMRATSIADMFDLTMKTPRKFVSIPSGLEESFFVHKPISYAPVDRE